MSGWSQQEINVACAAVILIVLLIGAVFATVNRYSRDKRGPWTL